MFRTRRRRVLNIRAGSAPEARGDPALPTLMRALGHRVLFAALALACGGACDGTGGADAEAASPWPGYVLERTIGGSGDALGQLRTPMGVAVDADGRVWIADTGNARVQIVGADGTHPVLAGSGWKRPIDIAIGAEGRVWVADLGADEVRCLRPGGAAGAEAEPCTAGRVSMPAPAGLGARDGAGPLAAQLYGHRVASAAGSPQLSVGGQGGGSGELEHPTDVAALSGGGFAVADAYNHRIQLFDDRGRSGQAWSGPGDAPFRVPTGVDASTGVIHVADSGRRRVVALDREGQVLATYHLEQDAELRIQSPVRVAAQRDRVWVADPANDRVLVLRRGR